MEALESGDDRKVLSDSHPDAPSSQRALTQADENEQADENQDASLTPGAAMPQLMQGSEDSQT